MIIFIVIPLLLILVKTMLLICNFVYFHALIEGDINFEGNLFILYFSVGSLNISSIHPALQILDNNYANK